MHHVASGKHAAARGHAHGAFAHDHVALLVRFDARGGADDAVGRTRADGQKHAAELLDALAFGRGEADGTHAAFLVAEKFERVGLPHELHAFGHGFFVFALVGRHVGLCATVDHRDVGSQAARRAGGVHRHIARTDHGHAVAFAQRYHLAREHPFDVGIHVVQEVGALRHAAQVGSRHVEILRQGCARAHEDGVEPVGKEAVDGHARFGRAHEAVLHEVHAQSFDLLHLVAHHGFRQAVLGDAVHEHAAQFGLSFENGDVESLAGQVAGHGEPGRAGTDDGHLAARLLGQQFVGEVHVGIKLCHKAFQFAHPHGVSFLAQHAVALALLLVRAHAAADGGKVRFLVQLGHGFAHVALRELVDEFGNVVADGAAFLALRHLAVQAALGFVDGLAGGEHAVHFLKAGNGFLFGNGGMKFGQCRVLW